MDQVSPPARRAAFYLLLLAPPTHFAVSSNAAPLRCAVVGAVREGGEDRGGHVRGGVQGQGPVHQRDDRAQEDPAGAGRRGRPVHRHPRDLPPQGDAAPEHRQVSRQQPAASLLLCCRLIYNTRGFSLSLSCWLAAGADYGRTDCSCRLQDVVHNDKCIYLVFEYLDLDLKKHMDSSTDFNNHRIVKVAQSVGCYASTRSPAAFCSPLNLAAFVSSVAPEKCNVTLSIVPDLLAVLPLPDFAGRCLLPLAPRAPPGSQAAEPAHRPPQQPAEAR
jgi:hypothetical protein